MAVFRPVEQVQRREPHASEFADHDLRKLRLRGLLLIADPPVDLANRQTESIASFAQRYPALRIRYLLRAYKEADSIDLFPKALMGNETSLQRGG